MCHPERHNDRTSASPHGICPPASPSAHASPRQPSLPLHHIPVPHPNAPRNRMPAFLDTASACTRSSTRMHVGAVLGERCRSLNTTQESGLFQVLGSGDQLGRASAVARHRTAREMVGLSRHGAHRPSRGTACMEGPVLRMRAMGITGAPEQACGIASPGPSLPSIGSHRRSWRGDESLRVVL